MKEVLVRGVRLGSGKPKICVPIMGATTAELHEEVAQCLSLPCELIEWRLDFFTAVTESAQVLAAAKVLREALGEIPLLVTFRTFTEGGVRELAASDYFALYEVLIPSGFVDLIDLELFMPRRGVETIIRLAKQHDVKVVMCNHDFKQTPSQAELISRLCQMQDLGADICKIAVMPQTSGDVLTLLAATNEMKINHGQVPIVTMAMGKLGLISRVSGEVFGSAMTFGAAGTTSAPGQIPAQELANLLSLFHQD